MLKEKQLQIQEIEYLSIVAKIKAILFFSIPNESAMLGMMANKAESTKSIFRYQIIATLKKTGMVSGAPDLFVGFNGRSMLIENKVDKNILSKNQEFFRERAILCGFDYFVIRSLDEFVAKLNWLIKG